MFEDTGLLKALPEYHRHRTLQSVADTNFSIGIAKYLLKGGVLVNYKRSGSHNTALRYAAKRDTADAAKFMKFLLLCGANSGNTGKRKIGDQKGAKNISKHLGMSWDELVAETAKQREQVLSQKDLSPDEVIEQLASLV
ncbi:hypothetical protein QBC37DRAFT_373215 [Rhypophila decipiens]|uniref:Uncharacterized protein n=1 Tax=Rhypophila decipiens TaxID=261697 RepID=A0AAN6Y917_9PEZI|nr:hypothetical protein QBC37DRAFT_373215 [Rhypophila decipiens]